MTPQHGDVGLHPSVVSLSNHEAVNYGGAAGKWRESTWGEEISLEYGKSLRGYDGTSGKFRVFGSNGPIGWTSQPLVPGPGVILGRKGAYRGVQYSRESFFVIDTAYYVVPKTDLDMRWLYYAIQHYKLGEIDDGSPIPSTTRSAVYVQDFQIPPLPEQKTIAHILGTLDDKIELNRKMNATLEAMARALFQSWFVGFDPVRAKLDERKPAGLDAATAALFPAHFQDSPLGQIPQGWEVKPMSEVIEVNPRRTLKSGAISPYLDMKNMPTQGHAADEVIQRVFSSGTKFKNGDTLLARITPCLENGKSAFVDFLEDGQVGWGSTEYIVFAPKQPLTPEFGYYLARSDALRLYAIQNMTGTSGRQRVPSECFTQFQLAVPPTKIAQRFGEITKPWMMMIHANIEQSRTLANLRDTLLPKLLSGEVSTFTADKVQEIE
jgi:type I restriction enzyme S subunit